MVYSSKPQCLKTERKTNKSGQSNHEQYCFSRLPVGCGSKRVLVEPPASPSTPGTPRHPRHNRHNRHNRHHRWTNSA